MSTQPTTATDPERTAHRNRGSEPEGRYRFPPGLDVNLLWYALRRFLPVDPIALFSHLGNTYGDIAHYKLAHRHIVYLNHPEYIREVLVVQHANFIKERVQQRSKILLGNGMITADGDTHWGQRRVAQPAFHRQRIATHAGEIVRRAVELREQWQPDSEVDIYREMMHYSLGVVGSAFFGRDLGEEVVALNSAVSDIMDVYHPLVLLPGIRTLLKIPFTPLRKAIRARDAIHAMADRLIDQHRLQDDNGDLLSMMLNAERQMQWSDEDLRGQVVTIFLAGYETMAIALTWTWYFLSQNPDVEARMHAEIQEALGDRVPVYEDLPRLQYTEMVLAESMRLYPPAWAMGREAVRDFALGEWSFPAGTTVLMSQYVMHRDPRYFDDPLKFVPERHTPEARAGRPRGTYLPFGMGPRQCIGESFAWMEGVLTLATLVQRFRVELVPGQRIEPQPLFTLRPKYGICMTLKSRG